MCTSHSPPRGVLLSIAVPHGHIYLCTIYFLLLRATDITLSSFWQVQVPYTKSQFQRFREVHWAVQINTFSLLSLRQIPCTSPSKCLSDFTLFHSAIFVAVPFFFCIVPPKLLGGHHLFLLFPPISFHTFLTTLSHPIPVRPLVTLSHTALSTTTNGWQPLRSLYHITIFMSVFVLSGYIHSQSFTITGDHSK